MNDYPIYDKPNDPTRGIYNDEFSQRGDSIGQRLQKKMGRPPGPTTKERTCVLSVRVPASTYDAFVKVVRFHGLKDISTPLKRFIKRIAEGHRSL